MVASLSTSTSGAEALGEARFNGVEKEEDEMDEGGDGGLGFDDVEERPTVEDGRETDGEDESGEEGTGEAAVKAACFFEDELETVVGALALDLSVAADIGVEELVLNVR